MDIHEYERARAGKPNRSGKFQIYAFRLETETTARISPDIDTNYRFANFEYLPK